MIDTSNGKMLGGIKEANRYNDFVESMFRNGQINAFERNNALHNGETPSALNVENYNKFAMQNGIGIIMG